MNFVTIHSYIWAQDPPYVIYNVIGSVNKAKNNRNQCLDFTSNFPHTSEERDTPKKKMLLRNESDSLDNVAFDILWLSFNCVWMHNMFSSTSLRKLVVKNLNAQ
jgi:hypothetical protein